MSDTKKHSASSFSIILGFVCLTLVGLAFIPMLPVKLSPSNELPQITVSYSMPGMTSRVVETEVTSRMESMLGRVSGVKNIYSKSGNGSGSVTIELNKNINKNAARFEVSTIVRQLYPSLPDGVSYPSVWMSRSENKSAGPFLTYTINAPVSSIQMEAYAEKHIKPALLQIEGIDNISINGASPMIWRLEYDYQQLRQYKLTVQDLQESIQGYLNKEDLGTGFYKSEKGTMLQVGLVLEPGALPEQFDASKIPVKKINGKMLYLNELVKATHVEEEPSSYSRINGLNSLYLALTAKEDANQLKLCSAIKKELEELSQHFPVNYEMHEAYNATDYIREELKNIYFRSGLTVLILLCFVLLVYRSIRYLLMIATSLLCTLSVASILYYLSGIELQLYSLMGVTISLSLILDTMIIMSDQIIRRKNKLAFLAILAATCTTMASLVIIFFLDEKIRENLQDFALIIIINLGVSLFVCLFLIPALIERMQLTFKPRKRRRKKSRFPKWSGKRKVIYFNRFYCGFINWNSKHKFIPITLLILLFGLPIFLLPNEIIPKDDKPLSKPAVIYNKTIGSALYQEKIKPVTDVALGGTLRLFVQKVYEGSYWNDKEETSLFVSLSMPNGSTIGQTNYLVQQMENYLKQFKEIKIFQTNVNNALQASINIRFTKAYQNSGFPYQLKSELINKAIGLGGGSWGVFGLGDGFSNDLRESAGSYRIKMYGFNYDELYALAEKVRDTLLQHRRIKEVTIDSDFSWFKNDYQEFSFDLQKERLAGMDILPMDLFSDLDATFGKNKYAGLWMSPNGSSENIRLFSKQSKEDDIWMLNNHPGILQKRTYRISEIAHIQKSQAPMSLVRENQQFRLCLQYEYIGAYEQGKRVLGKNVANFSDKLPLGYTIENNDKDDWKFGDGEDSPYWLLLIIMVIIFFTTSILFNSLRQPFVLLSVIPVAFIGIFLTFYGFNLKFDQGGFAAFVLLCSLTVNASIYFINEFNNISRKRHVTPLRAYIRAWNSKIIPVLLTILSTMLGFIPFLVGEQKGFWFPLASGVIGGLAMSLLGIFIFVPVLLRLVKKGKT